MNEFSEKFLTKGILRFGNRVGLTGIKDIDHIIFSQVDPKSVINLCQSSKQFSPFCDDSSLFRNLIKLHYPGERVTNTPRQQFIALANNIQTDYHVLINYDSEDDDDDEVIDSNGNVIISGYKYEDEAYLVPSDLNLEDYLDVSVFFGVKGLRPKTGDVFWLWIIETDDEIEAYPFPFYTKEEAVKNFIDNQYTYIMDDIIDKYYILRDINPIPNHKNPESCAEIINSDDFKAYLQERHYPYDMSKEGLFNYVMINSFFRFDPDNEDIVRLTSHQFIKVTIYNKHKC